MFGGDPADPTRLRIKICGITNAEDAQVAAELGADSVGLNCYRGSKRYLDLALAEWASQIPHQITQIAILVNPGFEEAVRMANLPFITGLQLHGSESPSFCARLQEEGVPFAKALPVSDAGSLNNVPSFGTKFVVLDSSSAASFGGTGETFSWSLARQFVVARPDLCVMLAGGLTPENVAEAIREVRPFGVDVTTGVESSAGRKDHLRLRAFIEAARGASVS